MEADEKKELVFRMFNLFNYDPEEFAEKVFEICLTIEDAVEEHVENNFNDTNLLSTYLALLMSVQRLIEQCPDEQLHDLMIEVAKLGVEDRLASVLDDEEFETGDWWD